MRRRDFTALLAGAAAWPLAARAQSKNKLPTIGFIGSATRESWSAWVVAFEERLRQRGWIDGRTIAIEYRWAEGHPERYAEFAAELVRLKVDIIVSGGAPAVAAKQATTTIPIVAAIISDPIGTGLVTSLAHPGGNVTGLSFQSVDVAGKRVDMLREAVPHLKQLAVLGNLDNPGVQLETREVNLAAQKLGLQVTTPDVHRAEDIAPAFQALKGKADAMYVCVDPMTNGRRVQIAGLARDGRLPTIFGAREYVEDGGLMSYGPNFLDLFRHAADSVDKILRGTKAGDIPIEQPTTFDFVVNLTTMKALGLNVPASQLSLAEIIE